MWKPSFSRGKIVLGGVAIAVLLAFGWYLSSLDGRIAIVVPVTSTPIKAVASEATSTITPFAITPTVGVESLSPQVEQARAFAEPILAAITDRPPDFEDDFSRFNPNWQIDTWDSPCGEIVDGRLKLNILPERMAQQQDGRYTCGAHSPNVLTATNFVFEVDLTQMQSEIQGSAGIQWRHVHHSDRPDDDSYYRVEVSVPGNHWALIKSSISPLGGWSYETVQEWQGTGSGRIRVVALGNQFAVYINEAPIFYLKDDHNPTGEIDLLLNAPDGPVTVEYDNVKLWNLDNVPELQTTETQARAFAEPILQAVANRMPDVEDDFSSDNGNWSLGYSDQDSAQIVDGMLRLTVADATSDNWMGSRHVSMSADDFFVQFDARVTAMEFDSHLSILWRYLPNDNKAYRLTIFPNLDGAWTVDNAEFQIAAGNSDAVTLNEWFTVTIIGRDNRFAVLLDGQVLSYFEDSQRPIGRVVLGMNIFSGDATAEFDNVKYWNLANVPDLP